MDADADEEEDEEERDNVSAQEGHVPGEAKLLGRLARLRERGRVEVNGDDVRRAQRRAG